MDPVQIIALHPYRHWSCLQFSEFAITIRKHKCRTRLTDFSNNWRTFSISEGQTMPVELLLHTKQQKTPISNQFWFQTSLKAQLMATEEVQLPNMLLCLSFDSFLLFFCSHACQSTDRGSMQCIFSSTGWKTVPASNFIQGLILWRTEEVGSNSPEETSAMYCDHWQKDTSRTEVGFKPNLPTSKGQQLISCCAFISSPFAFPGFASFLSPSPGITTTSPENAHRNQWPLTGTQYCWDFQDLPGGVFYKYIGWVQQCIAVLPLHSAEFNGNKWVMGSYSYP